MGQMEFEVGAITVPRSKITAGGSRKNKNQTKEIDGGVVIPLDDKTKLKKTDIIRPQDIENLSPAEATPYLKTKTLQLTIMIESYEEQITDTKSAMEKKHLELLEQSEGYREFVALEAFRKQAQENKKHLREVKNEILRDGDKLKIDLSSEAILNDLQNSGKKKLTA